MICHDNDSKFIVPNIGLASGSALTSRFCGNIYHMRQNYKIDVLTLVIDVCAPGKAECLEFRILLNNRQHAHICDVLQTFEAEVGHVGERGRHFVAHVTH
jgi:hypothetical protein